MDPKLIFAKTPTGDEAVRQRTRVVQRNLRMVLIMVDGKLTVEELAKKVANPKMVESALQELEEGGYIAPAGPAAATAWAHAAEEISIFPQPAGSMSAMSRFEPLSAVTPASGFSGFVEPIVKPVQQKSRTAWYEKLRVWKTTLMVKSITAPGIERASQPPKYKLIAVGVALTIVLGLVILLLYPYNNFKPEIEASASRLLRGKVTIGDVSLGLTPKPYLKLTSVVVGLDSTSVNIGEVRVFSPFAMLRSGLHTISRIDVSTLRTTPAGLLALPISGGAGLADDQIVVRQVRLEQSTLLFSDELALVGVKGELNFSEQGVLLKGVFENADRTLLLEAESINGERALRFSLEGRAWRPSSLAISFDAMQASGVLMPNRLAVQNIDTTFLGGVLKGNWLLDWSANGFAMAGEGTLTRLNGLKVGSALMPALKLEGDLAGPLRLRSTGKDWSSLWSNVEGMLEAEVTRGILSGVDLGEASRRGLSSSVHGGVTKFDRLRVSLAMKPGQIVGRNIQLDAGALNASGQFASDRENRIEALLNVNVHSSVANRRFPVQIAGKLPDLTVTVVK